jgi:steroid delta-isomerase-like uncharacterized protein
MTPDAVVRAWFEELWNQGKEETMDRLFAKDGLAHGLGPGGAPLKGPEAYRPFFHQFRSAFPDIHVDVVRTITEGDLIAAHCHVRGTHRGLFMGLTTGKPVDFWGMTIVRVQNDQIVEAWNTFDFMNLYQQIGVLPQLPG